MSLTEAQFDRIFLNWGKHGTPLSAGKLYRMLCYIIRNHDNPHFTKYDQLYPNNYNYLMEEAVSKFGNLSMYWNGGKWTYAGTILELYIQIRQDMGRSWWPSSIRSDTIDKITIIDNRCNLVFKHSKEICYILQQRINITWCLGHAYYQHISNPFCEINYHHSHYKIGKTLYYKAHILYILFLAKQLMVSDIAYHIGLHLIKLLDR
jgi:hypothetical protein